ncbi:hypothetical protein [Bradyrhizobium sp. B120]
MAKSSIFTHALGRKSNAQQADLAATAATPREPQCRLHARRLAAMG